tara:strand:+ start:531 stop:680 length:150 start_codon:yes stop_codon:yes gene_type:complete
MCRNNILAAKVNNNYSIICKMREFEVGGRFFGNGGNGGKQLRFSRDFGN